MAPRFSFGIRFCENYTVFPKLHPAQITRKMVFERFEPKNCSLCNFTVRNKEYANSTPRDLLLVSAVGTIRNIVPLMRTLRTTGSKCSVVLITDDESYIDPISLEIVQECGLQIIRCGNMNLPGIDIKQYKWSAYSYVYYYLQSFLRQNIDSFDRVMICDLFDTVFQGDPFNTQVTDEYINAVDEGATLSQSEENIKCLQGAGPIELTEEILNYHYACSGYFAGSAKNMLKLLDSFCDLVDFATNTPDQGIFNYIFLHPNVYGLKRSPFRETEFVHHFVNSKIILKKGKRTLGNVPTRRDVNHYASVLHHYYMSKTFVTSLLKTCPRQSKTQIKYVARFNEYKINLLEMLKIIILLLFY